MTLLAIAFVSFFLGAIPFSVLLARLSGKPDPRHHGSGNAGATNAARTGGLLLGACVLLLDTAKAFAPTLLASLYVSPVAALVAGSAAFLGHLFSPFLKGRGGKGVACFLGILLALSPETAGIFGACWGIALAVLRNAGIASVTASLVATIALVFTAPLPTFITFLVLTSLLIFRHHANIRDWIHRS